MEANCLEVIQSPEHSTSSSRDEKIRIALPNIDDLSAVSIQVTGTAGNI